MARVRRGVRRSATWTTRIGMVGVIAGFVALSAVAQQAAVSSKKPLDHQAYDRWVAIQGQELSHDGRWALFTLRPAKEKADATLKIRGIAAGLEKGFEVVRGSGAQFTHESRFALYLVSPDRDALKKAETEKVPPEKRPKNRLEILELAKGTTQIIDRVQSFRLPRKAAGWVAYQLEKPADAASAKPAAKPEAEPKKPEPAEAKPAESKPAESAKAKSEPTPPTPASKKKENGTELVLRNLEGGAEVKYPNVVDYRVSDKGQRLVYTTSTENGEGDGVFVVEIGQNANQARKILGGKGDYRSLVIDESGERVAFLSNRDDIATDKPAWSAYVWKSGTNEARVAASVKSSGLPANWWIAENRPPSFSRSGKRLFFGIAPRPKPEPKSQAKTEPTPKTGSAASPGATSTSDEEPKKVVVDVWHWKDPALQPEQLLKASSERMQSYLAMTVADADNPAIVPLADPEMPSVVVGSNGDADVALGTSDVPYRILRSWESPGFQDLYLVETATGKRRKIEEKHRGFASLSPAAKYAWWWDSDRKAWIAHQVASGKRTSLSELVPHPVYNEQHDLPTPPTAHGTAGWLDDDKALLVNDRFDLWAVDPESSLPPTCVTDGVGRAKGLRFRVNRLDLEKDSIGPDDTLLLSFTVDSTKAQGFARDKVRGSTAPEILIQGDESFGPVRKADQADVVMLTRSTFQKFPDLWVGPLDFKALKQISDANPQQKDYLWGTSELVSWTSLNGDKLHGILYKPEGFDPKKQYPMIVYFYERNSDNVNRYVVPAAGSSSINFSFYASRGYLVFVPDIPYRIGAPGPSAVNAILPGVARLVDQGFVDPRRIGVQGHSWGGYQVAYLVTQCNLFACAEAGAPVANMTSAYGGIRWSTGISRMFQYESTQSRIGATLWKAQQNYVDNSPIFWADRIETPLLILHNDRDGAVPWYQGIELFVALRRLGKPSWLLNYNGEDHGLTKAHNRKDFAVRMQQFFDHYLRGAAAPVWLERGVPAVDKGTTLGLELVTPTAEQPAKP